MGGSELRMMNKIEIDLFTPEKRITCVMFDRRQIPSNSVVVSC